MADLLLELLDELLDELLLAACLPTASALETRRTDLHELSLPLGDLHRMYPKLGGQLIERFLPRDRLQRHLGFERTAVSSSHGSRTSAPSSLTPLRSLLLNVWDCPIFGVHYVWRLSRRSVR